MFSHGAYQTGEEPLALKSCFHEWRLTERRRDLVEDIEKRIRDKIQGIEEVAAKPTNLMTDFFTALNKKYSIDPNQEELGCATSPARDSPEQPRQIQQEDAPEDAPVAAEADGAEAADEVTSTESTESQEVAEEVEASEDTPREEEAEVEEEQMNPTVQLG
jgi:hypothetical protein